MTEWFVGPNGTAGGAGTRASPLDIGTAANHASIVAGDTVTLLGGVYNVANYKWRRSGTAVSRITLRNDPGQRVTLQNSGTVNGDICFIMEATYVDLRAYRGAAGTGDLEFTCPNHLRNGTRNQFVIMDTGVTGLSASNCRYINLVLHDGYNGVAIRPYSKNMQFYGCISYYHGTQETDRNHGHGFYFKQGPPTAALAAKHCISLRNFGAGIQCYDVNDLENITLEGNISFSNGINITGGYRGFGTAYYDVSDAATKILNPRLLNNLFYEPPVAPTGAFGCAYAIGFGSGRSVENLDMDGEYYVSIGAGSRYAFSLDTNRVNPTIDGSTFIGSIVGFTQANFPNNTYLSAAPSVGKVVVWPNEYEAGTGHVGIYNPLLLANYTVDVSSFLNVGDTYRVRDTQNYFGPDIATGTVPANRQISIPMTSTAVAAMTGGGTPPPHTSAEFGAFVVIKTGTSTPPLQSDADEFNRADSTVLGTTAGGNSWVEYLGNLQILGNAVDAGTQTGSSMARVSSNLSSADHYAEARMTIPAAAAGNTLGRVVVRKAADSVDTAYTGEWERVNVTTFRLAVTKRVAGVRTLLAETPFGASGETHTIRLAAEGSLLVLYADGERKLSVTDAAISGNLQAGVGIYNDSGASPSAVIDSFSMGLLPKHPTALAAGAPAATSIPISFMDNNTDETGHDVRYRLLGTQTWNVSLDAVGASGTTGTRNYTIPSVQSGQTWEVEVLVYKTDRTGYAISDRIQAVTIFAPPADPSGLVGGQADVSSGLLSWLDNSNNETSFSIRRRNVTLSEAFPSDPQITGIAANSSSYVAVGLASTTIWGFQVRAEGEGGPSGWSNEAQFTTTTPPQAPAQPSNHQASGTAYNSARGTFNDNSNNEVDFLVEIDKSSDPGGLPGTFTYASFTRPANSTSWDWTDPSPGTGGNTYQPRVTARNANGNSAAAVSNVFTTPLQTPPAPGGEGHILAWKNDPAYLESPPDRSSPLTRVTPNFGR